MITIILGVVFIGIAIWLSGENKYKDSSLTYLAWILLIVGVFEIIMGIKELI
jgi:hypothetical protein